MAGPFWNVLKALGAAVSVFAVLYVFVGFALVRCTLLSLFAFIGLDGWPALRTALSIIVRDFKFLKIVAAYKAKSKHLAANKKSITDMFSETVSRHPNKPAILFEDQCWTFRELDCFANKVAHFFLDRGLKKGETVAIFMENCPELIGLCFGLGKIGVRSSLINYNLRETSLLHCLNICHPKAIVYSTSVGEALTAVQGDLDEALQQNIFSVGGNTSDGLEAMMKSLSSDAPPREYDAVAYYIYTSGTTGLPKAATIKQSRAIGAALGFAMLTECSSQDIIYCALPFYHSSAMIIATGIFLYKGTTLVMRRKFSASQFWSDCVTHKCTVVVYIGELCRYVLAQPDRPTDTQHCVRLAFGNGLRPQIWEQFQNRFKVPKVYEFYAATEGNAVSFNNTGKVGSCGYAVLLVDNKVILRTDPETGELMRDSNGYCIKAGFNEPGDLVGRIDKDTPFDGYVDQAATKKKILQNVFKKGDIYFITGDRLRMDEEGYLYFCDRTGDTFRWKGENVSTNEVEGIIGRALERDVIVFGVDVPGTEGKAGMACIVGDEESVDVGGLAEKVYRALPAYAVPLFVRLIQQADLTGTYKFQKNRLRGEGYDMSKVSDPLFILDTTKKTYVPLNEDKYLELQNGQIRF